MLSEQQIVRYSRHILVPEIGGVGQQRLLESTVRVVLAPDLAAASVAAWYLAGAGVGTLILTGDGDRIVTDDDVRASLPFRSEDVGRPAGHTLAARLRQQNPEVRVSVGDRSMLADAVVALMGGGDDSAAGALQRGGDAAVRVSLEIIRSA